MGSSSDLYADSILVGVSLLPNDNPPVSTDTDLHVAARSPDAFYELSQCKIGEAFVS
jgi:hypothetical protein